MPALSILLAEAVEKLSGSTRRCPDRTAALPHISLTQPTVGKKALSKPGYAAVETVPACQKTAARMNEDVVTWTKNTGKTCRN